MPVAMTEPDKLVREAAALWLRLRAQPADAALRDEVRAWRAQSAAHERVFAATEQTWALADELESPAPQPIRYRRRDRAWRGAKRRPLMTIMATAAAACLAIVAAPTLFLSWHADYRTATGETRIVHLDDGSVVTLDTGSAIAVDLNVGHRNVRLLAGRAWFDVARDGGRPFTVTAANATVTVTGTAFDVGLFDNRIQVALAHGGVRLAPGNARPLTMHPGDFAQIDRTSSLVRRSEASISSMGSWRRDRLLLENVSLEDGIAQLRRYYPGAILLTSNLLAERRVTGVFDVRLPADALRLMVRQHGATVRQITPWMMIVSDK